MEERFSRNILILISLIKLLYFFVGTIQAVPNTKFWTYELISISSKSSDTEKINIELEIERVSRGVYAISGEITINMDIVEGDANNIAAKCYRSSMGAGDFTVLPFQIAETHLFEFFNTYYKDVLMKTAKECSDLPAFKDKFQPPLERKTYKLSSCQFSQDGLPNHMQEGLYKVLLTGTGDVEWQLDITLEITPA